MALRKLLASTSVNSAATIAIFIACSWKSGTPSVRFEHLLQFVAGRAAGRARGRRSPPAPLRRRR